MKLVLEVKDEKDNVLLHYDPYDAIMLNRDEYDGGLWYVSDIVKAAHKYMSWATFNKDLTWSFGDEE